MIVDMSTFLVFTSRIVIFGDLVPVVTLV